MRAFLCVIVPFLLSGVVEGQDQDPAAQIDKLAESATTMVLYSLVPNSSIPLLRPDRRGEFGTPAPRSIKGFPILGETEITDKNEQKTLLKALARGARESDRTVMACFCPHHALHIESTNTSVTFVICFECLQVETTGTDDIGGFPISRSPQAEFDAALKRHNLTRSTESTLCDE